MLYEVITAGNDTLYGQAGDDTYSFSTGDGNDTIINQDSDGSSYSYNFV